MLYPAHKISLRPALLTHRIWVSTHSVQLFRKSPVPSAHTILVSPVGTAHRFSQSPTQRTQTTEFLDTPHG